MTIKEAWSVAGPLLWEGVRMFAPEVRVPADLIRFAIKNVGKVRKSTKKVRRRIESIDDMIAKMESKLADLKAERSEWVLHWGDLDQLLIQLSEFKDKAKGRRAYDGR